MRREEAIAELAKRRLAALSEEERAEQLGCMLHEDWRGVPEWGQLDPRVREELEEGELTSAASSARYDPVLLMWLRAGQDAVTNDWLREELGTNDEITGEPAVFEPCPCCGRRTLGARAIHSICTVCWWEDDGQDNGDADLVREGPNYELSLTQARVNYLRDGIANPRREDLRKYQEPARMYERGRQFILSDGAVSEAGTRWRSQAFDRE